MGIRGHAVLHCGHSPHKIQYSMTPLNHRNTRVRKGFAAGGANVVQVCASNSAFHCCMWVILKNGKTVMWQGWWTMGHLVAKFTDEQYTTINQSTAGHFDPRVFVNCLQVKRPAVDWLIVVYCSSVNFATISRQLWASTASLVGHLSLSLYEHNSPR